MPQVSEKRLFKFDPDPDPDPDPAFHLIPLRSLQLDHGVVSHLARVAGVGHRPPVVVGTPTPSARHVGQELGEAGKDYQAALRIPGSPGQTM